LIGSEVVPEVEAASDVLVVAILEDSLISASTYFNYVLYYHYK